MTGRTLRDTTGDGYEEEAPAPDEPSVSPEESAPPKRRRKRKEPTGEVQREIIDLAARHIAPQPLRPDPYHLDDDPV